MPRRMQERGKDYENERNKRRTSLADLTRHYGREPQEHEKLRWGLDPKGKIKQGYHGRWGDDVHDTPREALSEIEGAEMVESSNRWREEKRRKKKKKK